LRWRNDSAAPARSCLGVVASTLPRTLRVIVADDHDEMRLKIVRVLARRFLVIEAVASGDALVDAALVFQPDVIVSDMSMPALSGVDAMAALHDAGCRSPFVFVSACTSEALEWINRGALAVVNKVDLENELIAAVNAAASGFSYLSARARRVH
jgi:DNA-binding NarL/FixJ family response regulator